MKSLEQQAHRGSWLAIFYINREIIQINILNHYGPLSFQTSPIRVQQQVRIRVQENPLQIPRVQITFDNSLVAIFIDPSDKSSIPCLYRGNIHIFF